MYADLTIFATAYGSGEYSQIGENLLLLPNMTFSS